MTVTTAAGNRQQSQADGFSPADLEARLIAANERAALLEEQLAAVMAERDVAEHRVAQLEDSNRELASDLDDALDLASAHALDADHERLIPQPRYCTNAFAGLSGNAFADRTQGGMTR